MIRPGRTSRPSAFQHGFTLLEVMIALAVVAVALVTLLGLSNRSIGVNHRLQRITQATLLAQQRMTEIEVEAARPGALLRQEGAGFEPPFEEYRWQVSYEETPLPFIQIIKVTVTWGDERQNEAVDISSFVYRPEAAGGGAS